MMNYEPLDIVFITMQIFGKYAIFSGIKKRSEKSS